MLTQNTLDTLRQLKLTGMCDALEQQRAQPETHDLALAAICSVFLLLSGLSEIFQRILLLEVTIWCLCPG